MSYTGPDICDGETVDLTIQVTAGNGPHTVVYQLDDGAGPLAPYTEMYTTVPPHDAAQNFTTGALVATNTQTYTFTLVSATDVNGCTVPGGSLMGAPTVIVNEFPIVTMDPTPQTECEGDNAVFTVAATGPGLTYQWQEDNGGGFMNLPGETATTLTLLAITPAQEGNLYQCVVTATGNCSVTSASAALTVDDLANITVQPMDDTQCDGDDANFSITATGPGIMYQWQDDSGGPFADLPGETASTLTVVGVTVPMSGRQYRCVLTTTGSCVLNSSAATLTVNANPTSASLSGGTTICNNASATLTVDIIGGAGPFDVEVQINSSGSPDITFTTTLPNYFQETFSTGPLTMDTDYELLTITDANGCNPSGAIGGIQTVMVDGPTSALLRLDGFTATSKCTGSFVNLDITINGGTQPYDVEISTDGGFTADAGIGVLVVDFDGVQQPFPVGPYVTTTTFEIFSVVDNITCPGIGFDPPRTLTIIDPIATLNIDNTDVCDGTGINLTVDVVAGSGDYDIEIQDQSPAVVYTNTNYTQGVPIPLDPDGMTTTYTLTMITHNGLGCAVANTGNTPSVNSNEFPIITTEPNDVEVCVGDNTSFTVVADPTTFQGALTYQWREDQGGGFMDLVNGGVYSNVTTTTLNLTGVTFAMNGYDYLCVVTESLTCATNSIAVTLTVDEFPIIDTDPIDVSQCVGDNTSFTVVPNGGTTPGVLTFQWQEDQGGGFMNLVNGGVYSNVTTATMNLTGVTFAMDTYQYQCIVTESGLCSTTSAAATLTVFENPVVMTQPMDVSQCEGLNTTFTVTADATTMPGGLTYQWEEDIGGGFLPLADGGVYSGTGTATLTLTGINFGMDGYDYQVLITESGLCTTTSATATLTVFENPIITTDPTDENICEAVPFASFSVVADPSTMPGVLTYQWEEDQGGGFMDVVNGGIYTGANSPTLTLTGVTVVQDGYIYRCKVIESGLCTTTSASATLNVFPDPTVDTDPIDQTVCDWDPVSFTVVATVGAPTYQWEEDQGGGFLPLADGGVYSGTTTTILDISNTSGFNAYRYQCIVTESCTCSVTSNDAILNVYDFPLETTAPIPFTVCEGDNTSFTVVVDPFTSPGVFTYQWEEDQGGGFVPLANGGIYSNVTTATLNLTGVTFAMNGYDYQCIITESALCATTSTSALLTVHENPLVMTDPVDFNTCDGGNASFTVVPDGSTNPGVLTYQWEEDQGGGFVDLVNGGIYSDVTLATMNLTGVSTTEDGYLYRCRIIESGLCTVNSASATLNVFENPIITTDPVATEVCEGANVAFTVVNDPSTLPGIFTYQWQEDQGGGFMNLVDGGIYSNVTTATLDLTGVTFAMNGYDYQCVVTESATCSVTSLSANLQVDENPIVDTQPTNDAVCDGDNAQFSIVANLGTTPGVLTFQWQEDQGGGFMDLVELPPYSGTTTLTLDITGAVAGMNGYLHRCVVTESALCPTNSLSATLTVFSPGVPPVFTHGEPEVCIDVLNANTILYEVNNNFATYTWTIPVNVNIQFGANEAGFPVAGTGVPSPGGSDNFVGLTFPVAGMYSITVEENPGVCPPAVNTFMVEVNPVPTPLAPTGDTQVCPGGAGFVYDINPVDADPGSTYTWTIDAAFGFISAGQGTDQITVSWTGGSTGTTDIFFAQNNSGGDPNCDGISPNLTVEILDLIDATISLVAPTELCLGQTADVQVDITGTSVAGKTFTVVYNDGVNPDFTENNYTSGDPITVTPTVGGQVDYTLVSVTETIDLCTVPSLIGTASVDVTDIVDATISLTGTQDICLTDNTTIAVAITSNGAPAIGTYTVVYNDGVNPDFTELAYTSGNNITATPTVGAPITYTIVSVNEDMTGCTVPSLLGTAVVDVTDLVDATISIVGVTDLCLGQTTDIAITVNSNGAAAIGTYTVLYNDGVNPDVTVNNYTPGNPLTVTPPNGGPVDYNLVSVTETTTGCVVPVLNTPAQVDVTDLVDATISLTGTQDICLTDNTTIAVAITSNGAPAIGTYTVVYNDGVNPDFTELVYTSGNNITVTPTVGGTITYTIVSVTEDVTGCVVPTNLGTAVVNVTDLVDAAISLTGTQDICLTDNTTIAVAITSNGAPAIGTYTVVYNDGVNPDFTELVYTSGNNITVTPTVGGTITYTIVSVTEDVTGCVVPTNLGTAVVNVTDLVDATISLSGSTDICLTGTTTIQVAITSNGAPAIGTYTVVYNDGVNPDFTELVYTSGNNITVTPTVGGTITYTIVSVTEDVTGCVVPSNLGTAVVDVTDLVDATISLSGSTDICLTGTTTIQVAITSNGAPAIGTYTVVYNDGVNPDFTELVYTSGNNITVTPTVGGTITYTIVSVTEDMTGCVVPTNLGSAVIDVTDLVDATISLSGAPEICLSQSTTIRVDVTSNGGFSVGTFIVQYTDGITTFTELGYVSGTDITVTPTTDGTISYTLISVTEETTSCTGPALLGSADVDVTNLINATASLTGTSQICLGQSSTMKVDITPGAGGFAVGTFTVVYNDGVNPDFTEFGYVSGNNITITPTNDGTVVYTLVSVTEDVTGCVVPLLSGSAIVQVSDIVDATIVVSGTDPICFGDNSQVAVNITNAGGGFAVGTFTVQYTDGITVFTENTYISGNNITVTPTYYRFG